MINENHIPVIIVSYRSPGDIVECLTALSLLTLDPEFDVFVCENGASAAFDALVTTLTAVNGPCDHDAKPPRVDLPMWQFRRIEYLRLRGRDARVVVAEAVENFGYAGAVNAWLAVFHTIPAWPGVWVLNPDTQPEPHALAELVAVSVTRRKGMVGSRIVHPERPASVVTCGLQWRRLLATTKAIGRDMPAAVAPNLEALEARLMAPSGVSIYATRECIESIGPMDEQYFLYFEDLEWGLRAKKTDGVGYAHASIVLHKGGTTIGSSPKLSKASAFSVYLDFRNRMNFVRCHYRSWIAWTTLVLTLRSLEYGLVGAFANMDAAFRGLKAGIVGEIGRPDRVFTFDHQTLGSPRFRGVAPGTNYGFTRSIEFRRRVKIGISIIFYAVTEANRLLHWIIRRPSPHKLVILYYHGVPGNLHSNFVRQLDMLSYRIKIVPADYQQQAVRGGRSVAVTFDDAFVSALNNAIPELHARHLPATIFVPIGAMGCSPAWEMELGSESDREVVATADALRNQISDTVRLGGHSLTHPHLTRITREQARIEIVECRKQISDVFGVDARVFAFPYGDHDAETVELCREAGYHRVFTNIPEITDPASDKFVRGRVLIHPDDGPLEFYLKVSGAYAWGAYAYAIKRWIQQFFRRAFVL